MVASITTGCANMHLPKVLPLPEMLSPLSASDSRYGTRCIMIGLWHDAKFHLERAVKNNPHDIFACNNLGVVYEYFGDNDAAKYLYEKAVRIAIENVEEEGTKRQQKNGKSNIFEQSCYQNLKGFMEEIGQTEAATGTKTNSLSMQRAAPASKKILSKRVEIQKKLPPILNIDDIDHVGILVMLPNEKAEEIIKRIVEVFKERIQEESSFCINEEILRGINEVSSARNAISLQNHEAIIELCNDSNVQGLFVFEIMEFNDNLTKMITTKSRYSEEERRYIYYDIPSVNRKVTLKIRFCFLEAKTGNLLWDKKYDISKVKEYPVEDEEKIPRYDMELFGNLCNELSSNFISAAKPQYKYSKRQVLIMR
jgi:tetratricopeptide (TPR) repeat protein